MSKTAEVRIELPNGSHTNISAPVYQQPTFPPAYTYIPVDNSSGSETEGEVVLRESYYPHVDTNDPTYNFDAEVADPNSSSTIVAIDTKPIRDRIESTVSAHDQIEANGDSLIDEIYANYTAGELNSTDLLDPTTLATQASTDYNSTGYYGFRNAELRALGVSGNTNVSHRIRTTHHQTTYANGSRNSSAYQVNVSGTLFLTTDQAVSLETGEEYDPGQLPGSVYMTVSQMEGINESDPTFNESLIHVDDNFTILEATNVQTGESVNNTTATVRDYSETDASNLENETDQLQQNREYYEQQATQAGGGSGWFDWDGDGQQDIPTIALLGGVVVLFLVLSSGGGGGTLNIGQS
jgi:hypothetical protein